ncbi:MAG TPA: carboxypeptidase regulatory-like domain-containing protein [Terracidiphilus sp.]|nr:carboxypeptidase regulatory-like domain-containing protein [Terracidiphilus sp.]
MAVAGAGRNWLRLALAVLLAGAGASAGGQTAGSAGGGSLTGKLTDLHSAPLNGATVVVRNEATGAEARGTTGKNGSFRFGGLEVGAYTVFAESPKLGRGRLDGVVVSAGHEARVQAAMAFETGTAQPEEVAANAIAPATAVTNRALIPATAPTPAVVALPVAKTETARVASDGQGADPLRELALAEHRAAEFTREQPVADTEVLDEPLAVEALREMALSGRALPSAALGTLTPSAQIAAASPDLTDSVAAEPMLTLNLNANGIAGRADADAASMGQAGLLTAGGLAASVAASAVRASILAIKPKVRPALAVTERVDPAAASGTTTMPAAELQALPAAGRRWQDFVLDTPTAATAGGVSQNSLRGAGQEPAETSIDGASTRMAFGGQGSSGPESQGPGTNGQGGSDQNGMGRAWAGGHGSPVAEAAIREVQTVAGNAEAEGARTAGGWVKVETRRGTNGLHGQGFFFDRQNTWGAQNPFTQWVKETAPATASTTPVFTSVSYTPPDHESVWGIGLGSQLRRDKLFWFGALDSYRRNDPGLSMVKYPEEFFAQPSNDQMQVLSARLGLSPVNPIDEGLAQYWQELTTLDGLLGPAPRRAAQWVGFGRLDWQAAERHRFTLEGTGARWNSPGGGLTRVSENYGTNSFGSSEASEELLLGRWEAFLTPNLLAVTQGSAGRSILAAHADTPSAYEQTFLAPSVWGQLPQMVVDSRYGFTIGNPSRFGTGSYPDERVYQAQETVDWVRGNMLVKGGFELSHNADATSLLRNQTGTYTYSNVVNFASDALVFAKYGLQDAGNVDNQHGCDPTGTSFGILPCYSYYSQTMGPTNWNLSTNDWAGFWTAQWQPGKLLVVSGGLRWEREQLPPPIAALNNPDLPLSQKLPNLGNDWGPRISLALGSLENHWPVLRLGYGMYFGRTENATVETALTQTGSPNGDLNFFMRPTDNLNAGGAPPFPYVLSGKPASVVKPGAVEFASNFRNPEVHQAVAAVEEELPGHVQVTASAMVSLGRRLPVFIDANLAPPTQFIIYQVCDQTPTGPNNTACGFLGLGPIKTQTISVPVYASVPSLDCPNGSPVNTDGQSGWLDPCYQQINQITSKANSTYESAVLKIVRYGHRGLSLHAHYTYSHTMDWNPNESPANLSFSLTPPDFNQEYGTSDQDMRHSAAAMVIYEAPWKLHNLAGELGNGWMLSGIGQFFSGLPYTMRTSGSLPEERITNATIVGLGPGMNGSGGDNRVLGVGRNTYRYPSTWKADLRLGKKFDMGQMRQLELLVESFNLFNHQNVTEIETTGYYIESGTPGGLPTLNFLTGLKVNPTTGLATPAFGQPLNINATNFYRERQIQVGVRMRF